MFFFKRFCGEVIECSIRRDYTLPGRYTKGYRDCNYNCEYEHVEEFDGSYDYYVEYQCLVIKFDFRGKERIEKFNNITLHSYYKNSDKIVVIYNVLNKTFKIKS